MSCTASRRKRPSSVANRNLFKSCPSPARWSGSSCRRERLSNQVVLFRSPSDPPQCPECCANPRLLCRGTNGSNPSPSSEASCEPRFLAILLRSRSGTDGSNPLPSSGESGANLSLSGIRLSTSRSRSFPRVCGLWEVARSAETGIRRRHRADRRQRLYWAKFQYRTADDVGGLMKPVVFEFGSGSFRQTERGPLIVPGERQT